RVSHHVSGRRPAGQNFCEASSLAGYSQTMLFPPELWSNVSLQPCISRRRFGQLLLGGVAFSACIEDAWAARARNAGDGLPRSQPELQGVHSASILAFLADVEQAGVELHSFMMSRNGSVISEGWWWPYQPQSIHMTHSL